MNKNSIHILIVLIVILLKSVIAVAQDNPSIQPTRDTIILRAPDIRFVDDGWNLVNGNINGANLHFMAKSREDSLFQYIFGSKKIASAKNDSVEALAIFLRKNDRILSEINFEIDFSFMSPGAFIVMNNILIDGIDKVLDFGFGRGACGYGYNNALFFRRDDQLIKGMLLFTDGEGGASYDQYQFVPPLKKSKNQIWVEHKEGFYPVENDEIIYYKEYLRYKYKDGNLRLLNPRKDKF